MTKITIYNEITHYVMVEEENNERFVTYYPTYNALMSEIEILFRYYSFENKCVRFFK